MVVEISAYRVSKKYFAELGRAAKKWRLAKRNKFMDLD